MPNFSPFCGLRFSSSHIRALDDVVCPPYDVISEAERQALLERSPSNIVRLELPSADGDPAGPYQAAAKLLDAWRDGGLLRRDPKPCFYGYKMTFGPPSARRSTVGVIGALELEEPGKNILPHEETTPKDRTDRLELLRATRANLSPIWCLSPVEGLAELLQAPARPAEHASDPEGVRHELWPIDDPGRQADISALVGQAPLLIADGHHRYETALAYLEERRAAGLEHPADRAVMALVVELSEEQLNVGAIHRLICDLPPQTDLIEAVSGWCEVRHGPPADETLESRMAKEGAMALVSPKGTWLLVPTEKLIKAASHDTDSARVDLLRAQLPPHRVHYQHGWQNAVASVLSGAASAAFLVRPVPVSQIAAIARGGSRMPPKTTFFWPKPRTGMVVRELI